MRMAWVGGLLTVCLLGMTSPKFLWAQGIEHLPGMPGGLTWGLTQDSLVAMLGQAEDREELPARGVVRLEYAAEEVFPGARVSYDFAPGRGLAKGDYMFTVTGDCEEAYEVVAEALEPPYADQEELNFCRLPASMPIASQQDAAGAILGVMTRSGTGRVIITYESPFYQSFITGRP